MRAPVVGGGCNADSEAHEVRQQKTDTRDAEHLLDLLRTGRFPRIWVPSLEERDLRQLLVHRLKLVRMRTAVKNQLHAIAIGPKCVRKNRLWSVKGRAELDSLTLLPWATRRRKDLLERVGSIRPGGAELDRAVEEAGQHRRKWHCTNPSRVGPVVSLAMVLTLGRSNASPTATSW